MITVVSFDRDNMKSLEIVNAHLNRMRADWKAMQCAESIRFSLACDDLEELADRMRDVLVRDADRRLLSIVLDPRD